MTRTFFCFGLALAALALGACSNVKTPGWMGNMSMPSMSSFSNGVDANMPALVLEFQNADGDNNTIIVRLNDRYAELNEFVRALTLRGYYNDQFFYREIPGSYLLVGKARLSGRPTLAGPYMDIKLREKAPDAGKGDIGLVVHVDGTVGPELMLRYGYQMRDTDKQPQNVAIGRIVSGGEALEKVRKGDKLLHMYFQTSPTRTNQ